MSNARAGELGSVLKKGHGKTPVILIPDMPFSGHVFEDFARRHNADFTMYAVTLSGFGGTPALPPFERRDYAQRRLWTNAEDGVMNLMRHETIRGAVLIGQQAGAYLAMKIALDHPESVRAVVVLNGLLFMPMPSTQNPSGKIDAEMRNKIAEGMLPVELLPRPSPECYAAYIEKIASMFCRNPERGKALAEDAGNSDPYAMWDYFSELISTDLSDEIKNLKVPLLAVPSIPDIEMAQKIPTTSLNQWKEVQSPMVTVAPVENSRSYATEDNPEALDRILEKFLHEH
jgi:pimeloyl-ACP methyl ester carboxylesterase